MNKSKFLILNCSFALCILSFAFNCYAKEITIIYTGDTHAALYPCNCPIERDGGLARRATLINQLKKDNPNTLVLDAGRFFAGGALDEYTQNTELDMQRTQVNLRAMELMKYDAVAVSDDEFNFGREFLQDSIEKSSLVFLSCNLKAKRVLPYIIKDVGGVKIGIISVTGLSARQKAGGLEIPEPGIAVKKGVQELKKQGAQVIVLLSNLEEDQTQGLLKELPEINIVVMGRSHIKKDYFAKVGSVLMLKPGWQARRLGRVNFSLKENKISDYSADEIRLSDKIADSPQVLSILPACFSDRDCRKEGLIGSCLQPATLKANCAFSKPALVSVLIIAPKSCRTCDTQKVVDFLKGRFPGLTASYLSYPDARASKLKADLGIKVLPAYLLGKEIEKEKGFDALKTNLEMKGDLYLLKSEIGGMSCFIDRETIKGKLDLFISLYAPHAAGLLDTLREFNPKIHFLAVAERGDFDAGAGRLEVEDYLRAVCVQKYYPGYFWNYTRCRAGNINSSWWEDCLEDFDTQAIKTCSRTEEGRNLLRENISLNKELQIMKGPTYLLDNQEIFSSTDMPDKEELREIITKRR